MSGNCVNLGVKYVEGENFENMKLKIIKKTKIFFFRFFQFFFSEFQKKKKIFLFP